MPVQPRRAALTDSAIETVRFAGVGFGYADGTEVLRDVNLILPAGSFHFLTGPSGAGKSTLLSLLTLARRPTRGDLALFGEDAGSAPRPAARLSSTCRGLTVPGTVTVTVTTGLARTPLAGLACTPRR